MFFSFNTTPRRKPKAGIPLEPFTYRPANRPGSSDRNPTAKTQPSSQPKNFCVQKSGVQKCSVQNFGHNNIGHAKSGHAPPATQTKPGLLSYQSFNHKNHSADNTLTHRLLPTKKARQLPWAGFLLANLYAKTSKGRVWVGRAALDYMTGAIRDYNHPSIVHDFKKIFFRAQTCTRFICTHVSFLKQVVIFGSIILQCDDKPSPGFYHTNHLIIKIIVQTTP